MSRPASKFSGLLSAVQSPPQPPLPSGAETQLPVPESVGHALPDAAASSQESLAASAAPPLSSPAVRSRPEPGAIAEVESAGVDAPRRRGRPSGKRSDPTYEQVTAYIRRQTYRDVRIALLAQGNGQEFSELVEELLARWLHKRA